MNSEKIFKMPGKDFRGALYWAWNDYPKDEELIRQIREMKDKGMGGFFMHARMGHATPYLSPEWMDRVKTAVGEAKRIGMNAWLYDEDGWPSGFAGGKVIAKDKKFRLKLLEIVETGKGGYSCSFIYAPYTDTCTWLPFRNFCYIDTLNPKAVRAFIKSTYEAYYKEIGKEFGHTVPGVFTDEPSYIYHPGYESKGFLFPWTSKFPYHFQKKNGYDIRKHLISLVDNVGNYHKVRYDYRRMVTELFVDSYSRQVYSWCDKHNLKYTGHYLHEDSLKTQTEWIGAAMPHYEYMHVPGIDHLDRQIKWHLMTVKQVSSVAHQLGKERVLSELYGSSGWNLSFEEQKWIGDWEYVLGINFRCQHLGLYTMRGFRKRDYPPGISYQQPWWKYHKKIADYFARLSFMLSQGKFMCNILVLHPIESAWAVYTPRDHRRINRLNNSFLKLSRTLCELHRDYDYGDESLMEKYGCVRADNLVIGESSYKLVIIPPAVTLRQHTFELLKRFVKKGGRVIAIKPLPYLIDGERSAALKIFFDSGGVEIIKDDNDMLKASLSKLLLASVSITDAKGRDIKKIYCHERKLNNKRIYFFVNIDPKKGLAAVIRIRQRGCLKEWDMDTGEVKPVNYDFKHGCTQSSVSFAPAGSPLLVLTQGKRGRQPSVKKRKERKLKFTKSIVLGNGWTAQRLDPNALTLDYCRYQVEGKRWSRKVPVLKAQEKIKGYFSQRDNVGEQELRKRSKNKRMPGRRIHIRVRYDFDSQIKPDTEKRFYLVVENPEKFRIRVNNRVINASRVDGWWIDTSFKKIDITQVVREGNNVIELSYDYRDDMVLESCYVIGDFGVTVRENKNFMLVDEKKRIRTGNWVKQGYPFFAGTIAYIQKVNLKKQDREKVYIELDKVKGTATKVIINGEEIGILAWAPYRLEATGAVIPGENEVRIEVTNTLRNLLGPHHQKEVEPIAVTPASFFDEAGRTDKYKFVKCGLLGEIKFNCYA